MMWLTVQLSILDCRVTSPYDRLEETMFDELLLVASSCDRLEVPLFEELLAFLVSSTLYTAQKKTYFKTNNKQHGVALIKTNALFLEADYRSLLLKLPEFFYCGH